MKLTNIAGAKFDFGGKSGARKRTMVTIGDDISVSETNYVRLLNYVFSRVDEYDDKRIERNQRYQELDCLIGGFENIEQAKEREIKRRDAKRAGRTPLEPVKLNMTLERLEDAATSIMGILYPSHSFYRVAAPTPKGMDKAHAMQSILNIEATQFKHYSELSKIVMQELKYNWGGGVVEWSELYGRTFESDTPGTAADTTNGNVTFEGNRIVSFDPYNTGWDMGVNIEDVAREGEYVYTVQRESLHKLRKRMLIDETIYGPPQIKETLKNLVHDVADIRSKRLRSKDYDITSDYSYMGHFGRACRYHARDTYVFNGNNHVISDPRDGGTDWDAWSGLGNNTSEAFGTTEVTQIWMKLNPRDFGLGKVNTIETWYFEIVGDVYIVFAAKIGEGDAPLPVFMGTLSDYTNVVDKSRGEMIMGYQKISERLLNQHFTAVKKRLVGGRTFIRKGMANVADIANAGIDGVHEVANNNHDRPISNDFHQINDIPATESALDDVQALDQFARNSTPTASGKVMTDLDRATKHQSATVKYENSRIMNHLAALMDSRTFLDMRQTIGDNELINREEFVGGYITQEDITADGEGSQLELGERKTFTVQEMREVKLSVSTGLMNIDRFAILSNLETIINFAIQSGERNRFDMVALLNYYSDLAGVETDLSAFIEPNPLNQVSPELQQAMAQLQQTGQLEAILTQVLTSLQEGQQQNV